MVKLRDGSYRCSLCGKVLHLPRDAHVHFSVHAASGKANVRVITVGDEEIHRCPTGPENEPQWR